VACTHTYVVQHEIRLFFRVSSGKIKNIFLQSTVLQRTDILFLIEKGRLYSSRQQSKVRSFFKIEVHFYHIAVGFISFRSFFFTSPEDTKFPSRSEVTEITNKSQTAAVNLNEMNTFFFVCIKPLVYPVRGFSWSALSQLTHLIYRKK